MHMVEVVLVLIPTHMPIHMIIIITTTITMITMGINM